MEETIHSTRREMLRGTGGIAAGSMLSFGWGGLFTTDDPEEIDVNVFMGEKLYDQFTYMYFYNSSAFEPADITAAYIESVVGDLVADMDDVDVGVTVIEDPIPTRGFEEDDSGTYLGTWEDYIDTELPDSDVAEDSNLLLAADKPNAIINGDGEIPCSACDGEDQTAALVYDVSQFDFYGASEYDIQDQISDDGSLKVIGTAVHEVGHTLGLEHDDGIVYEDRNEYTIMGSPIDIRGEGYQLMRFNDEIQKSDLQIGLEDTSGWFFDSWW